ncbi:MAG: acyltransferase [Bacteroidota bacterium]|nr:acyltransferase [Bacteroidota bacterium]
MKLKSLEVLRSGNRISSVDVFRAFAILPVVVFHFNKFLPYGELGVDLFFVISGLLVGSILIRKFKRNERISFSQFILQRGFKIWPSYYWFLLVGSFLAYLFYSQDKPEYIIGGGRDMLRYIFFYQNYTGLPFHWPFDHIWSLCVEEHFYILLPILFIIIKGLFSNNRNFLFLSVAGLIAAGIVFKILSIYFTNSKDTYSATHNRIDALGWGVMLGILVTYFENYWKKVKWLFLLFILGAILFAADVLILIYSKNYFFEKVIFHSVVPFCFFLMLLGLYYRDFSRWKPIRFIAYYSYNWYLWHPIFVWIISKYVGINVMGLVTYMIVSFLTAMLFTILVEERFLSIRETVMGRIFKRRAPAAA